MSNDSSSFTYTPSPADPVGHRSKPKKPTKPVAEEAALRKDVPWTPLAAVLFAVIVYFLAQFIGSMVVIWYAHLRGWHGAAANNWLDHSIVAQFSFVAVAEVVTFGSIWWFIHARGAGLRAIGWRWPRLKDPLYTLAGFFAYFAAYAALLFVATHLFPSLNIDQKQQLGFNGASGTDNLLLTFLSLVVLPPLVEETVFRGFVFAGLRNKLQFVWAALGTSALFASAHLQFGSGQPLLWVAALDTFTLSLVLCYLREKTDSLWPGILLHALKNGLAFMSLFILR